MHAHIPLLCEHAFHIFSGWPIFAPIRDHETFCALVRAPTISRIDGGQFLA